MSYNSVGIDKMGVYVPEYYIEMTELAEARDIDPNKFLFGIGQEKMAVPPKWEDIVTMGANAAKQIISDEDRQTIDQIIFATESSFDFSKAAATHIHKLLDIQEYAKSYEIKQACYSGTAGLLSAFDYVRLRPDRKVLVIMSDISRYGLQTSGESTQGAGAVALLITANPRILALDAETVSHTNNQYDFWRPSYSDYAIVESKFSTQLYLDSFLKVMEQVEATLAERLQSVKAIAFHLPFTKMANKALKHYLANDSNLDEEVKQGKVDEWSQYVDDSKRLNRQVGNIYTGSLYLSLYSLLLHSADLKADDRIGLFSYGSGSVSEFLTGILQPDFQQQLKVTHIDSMFDDRKKISISKYEQVFDFNLPQTQEYITIDEQAKANHYYLSHIEGHRRYYELKEA